MPFLLYALITWTTRDRAPLITAAVASFLRKTLPTLAKRYGAEVLEMGIVDDHVHVLVRLPARFDVPRLAQGLKGAAARLANPDGITKNGARLYWASGYDLRSVGVHGLREAKEFLRTQPAKHPGREPVARSASAPRRARPSGRDRDRRPSPSRRARRLGRPGS